MLLSSRTERFDATIQDKSVPLKIQKLQLSDSAVYYCGCVSCQELTAVKEEESSLEDSTVTLSYRYSRKADSNDYFFWYRQYPGKPPEFLIYISGLNTTRRAESLKSDKSFSTKLSEEKKRVDLQIISAKVTDSAVYYCAVRPTVTGNTKTLYKNLWSKDNRILHNIH
ncbi:T-cell receptor alpha chain V region CTL-L17 [Nibea albiflora]|nr:T-cell receptor alpha chain V region CTL-L17 [Nibea albiflora]